MRTKGKVRHNEPTMTTTIAFVHAHPDDEALLTAGTMAKAAAAGHRVVLIMATDGAAGLTASQFSEDLAHTRSTELQRSAQSLGVATIHALGYPDSGMDGDSGFAQQPVDEVADRIAHILDAESASIVVGYDPQGGYGHPDHRQVHRVTRVAAARAETAPTLFEVTLPREPIVRAVRAASALRLTPADFDPDEFADAWTPGVDITHRVDIRKHWPAKRAALRAHASQAVADDSVRTLGVLSRLPLPVLKAVAGREYYVAIPTTSAAVTGNGSQRTR